LRSKHFNFLSICSTSNLEGSFNFERASLHVQRAHQFIEREREKGGLKEGPAREKKKGGSLIFPGRSFSRPGRFKFF
jgi:hypothetical protein